MTPVERKLLIEIGRAIATLQTSNVPLLRAVFDVIEEAKSEVTIPERT